MKTVTEWSNNFDIYYNNITSDQAPGFNEYEKSVLLTRAQEEIVKNYFSATSKGNALQQGFDDSVKRQADFSKLIGVSVCEEQEDTSGVQRLDSRSKVFLLPQEAFILINEALESSKSSGDEDEETQQSRYYQVIPVKYSEYTTLMSKSYKRPLKSQAWRLTNSTDEEGSRQVEIIVPQQSLVYEYRVRYVKRPEPIILTDLEDSGFSINGETAAQPCSLDESLHEDILQRAVELAKIVWASTGQNDLSAIITAGQRSE